MTLSQLTLRTKLWFSRWKKCYVLELNTLSKICPEVIQGPFLAHQIEVHVVVSQHRTILVDSEVANHITILRIKKLSASLLETLSSLLRLVCRQVLPFCSPQHVRPNEAVISIHEPNKVDNFLHFAWATLCRGQCQCHLPRHGLLSIPYPWGKTLDNLFLEIVQAQARLSTPSKRQGEAESPTHPFAERRRAPHKAGTYVYDFCNSWYTMIIENVQIYVNFYRIVFVSL